MHCNVRTNSAFARARPIRGWGAPETYKLRSAHACTRCSDMAPMRQFMACETLAVAAVNVLRWDSAMADLRLVDSCDQVQHKALDTVGIQGTHH